METSKIQISKEKTLATYKNATDEGKQLLENLFGKELFTPKDVTERIKTFEDALNELGENHILVRQYQAIVDADDELELDCNDGKDAIAYFKLRIICAALNEGWIPKFTTNEYRYYPWFYLYTQKEIDNMNEDDKAQLLYVGGSATNGAHCGVAFAASHRGFSASGARLGARLAFKTRELAEYAGRQFIEVWCDFVFHSKNEVVEEEK